MKTDFQQGANQHFLRSVGPWPHARLENSGAGAVEPSGGWLAGLAACKRARGLPPAAS